VEGNGKSISSEREIATFDKIEIEGVFNVILSQGGEESLKIETDEDIQLLILTNVENGILKVKMKDSTCIKKLKNVNTSINISDINKLSTTGVGKLTCTKPLNLRQLELKCKGVGATELKIIAEKLTVKSEIVSLLDLPGTVKEVDIRHSGLGAIKAFELKTEKLKLLSEGIGAAEINASQELSINVKGFGAVKYKGNPAIKRIKKEGLGKVESAD